MSAPAYLACIVEYPALRNLRTAASTVNATSATSRIGADRAVADHGIGPHASTIKTSSGRGRIACQQAVADRRRRVGTIDPSAKTVAVSICSNYAIDNRW